MIKRLWLTSQGKWQEISSKLHYQSKESLNNQMDNRQSRFSRTYDFDSEGRTRKETKVLLKDNISLIKHYISLNSHTKSNTMNKYQCILNFFLHISTFVYNTWVFIISFIQSLINFIIKLAYILIHLRDTQFLLVVLVSQKVFELLFS